MQLWKVKVGAKQWLQRDEPVSRITELISFMGEHNHALPALSGGDEAEWVREAGRLSPQNKTLRAGKLG